MSDVYSSLNVSPKKKRTLVRDDNTLTPKKMRMAPPTPPPSSSKKTPESSKSALPVALSRLDNIQTALQYALSHALATCAISPTSDSGHVRNVLNHISLTTYHGFTTSFEVEDLKRLCWVWEWDGKSLKDGNTAKEEEADDEDNPFITRGTPEPQPADWTRGSMGMIISPATHFSKRDRKRVPAYGIGIEVEMDIDKDMGSGMAAVARWTAGAEQRRTEFRKKLESWIELHPDNVPEIPLADLPELCGPKMSALTRTLASISPSAATSSFKLPAPPSSPSRSPAKKSTPQFLTPFPGALSSLSPAKKASGSSSLFSSAKTSTEASSSSVSPPKKSSVLFPQTLPKLEASASVSPPKKSSLLFPQTPSKLFPQTPSRRGRGDVFGSDPPQTPSSAASSPEKDSSVPSTPVHQRDSSGSPAVTPSTARREALKERIRQRSLSTSPTKTPRHATTLGSAATTSMTRDQMLKLSQDEMRRRCLLGRLAGMAESIWMLFSNPAASGSSTPSRKRRALPTSDVITAVIKSSPVPISTAEANESIDMLVQLCPFFLRKLDFSGDEFLEMPAPAPPTGAAAAAAAAVDDGGSPSKPGLKVPPSPGRVRGKDESAQELLMRSPKRVTRDTSQLGRVREIIRRELELQD